MQQINIDKLCGVAICSSHPHHSESEGVTYNIGSSFITGMKYHVMKIPDKSEKSEVISPESKQRVDYFSVLLMLDLLPHFHSLTNSSVALSLPLSLSASLLIIFCFRLVFLCRCLLRVSSSSNTSDDSREPHVCIQLHPLLFRY